MNLIKEGSICGFCGNPISKNDNVGYSAFPETQEKVLICGHCIKRLSEQIDAADTIIKKAVQKAEVKNTMMADNGLPHPKDIKEFLDTYIIGQDEAKEILSVAVYNHYKMLQIKRKNKNIDMEKSNVMLLGPSGCGKTAILRALAKILKVPFTAVDITAFSSSGYVGRDVETIIRDLIHAADGDVEQAEYGIVYIDEIDKTARKGENLSTTADPSHEGVQQALLKLLEGNIVDVPEKGQRYHPQAKISKVDTSNILFVVGGAFEGIEKIVSSRLHKKESRMGAGATLQSKKNDNYDMFVSSTTTEDLKKFGMLPEILGRIPIICPMKELTKKQLMRILCEPKNALVKQYGELLKHDGITLEITDKAIEAIAAEAIERKVGARGLRGIMEKILNPVMYEAPDLNVDAVTLDVDDNGKVIHVYSNVFEDKEAAI